MEQEEDDKASVGDAAIVERAPNMYKRVRFLDEGQTDITQTETVRGDCHICSMHAGMASAFIDIAQGFGYVIPPAKAKKLKGDRLFVRRQAKKPSEWEFVKKKTKTEPQQCDNGMVCKQHYRVDEEVEISNQHAEWSPERLAKRERLFQLDVRLQALKAELAATEACQPDPAVKERKRRPYQRSCKIEEPAKLSQDFDILPMDPIVSACKRKPHKGCKKHVVRRHSYVRMPMPEETWTEPEVNHCRKQRHCNDPCYHGKHKKHQRHHYGIPFEHFYPAFKPCQKYTFDDTDAYEWPGLRQRITIPRKRVWTDDCDDDYRVTYEDRSPRDYCCRW